MSPVPRYPACHQPGTRLPSHSFSAGISLGGGAPGAGSAQPTATQRLPQVPADDWGPANPNQRVRLWQPACVGQIALCV